MRWVVRGSLALVALGFSLFLGAPGQRAPTVVYGQDYIPGRYIVVLDDGVDPAAAAEAMGRSLGFESDIVYTDAINGFAAQMSPQDAQQLAQSGLVQLVTADSYVHTSIHTNPFQTLPTGVDRIDADTNPTAAINNGGPNLNVDVAVIDTGVTSAHVDLNVAGGAQLACTGNTYEDDNGHGTHVAGTIAAIDDNHGVTGVAPGARIWGVKVLDANGSGANSCVVDGIDWVTNRRQEYNDGAADGDPGINIVVANLSLGGPAGPPPAQDPMCLAMDSAIQAGVMFAVAAGNESDNTANHSPSHCPNAVTVSAFGDFDGQPGALSSTSLIFSSCPLGQQEVFDDTFACFSNWGSGVDIAAPGVDILSTYPGPGGTCEIVSCYAWMSGTSMATPHVTGALALLYLEGYNGAADSAAVMAGLTAAGHTRAQNSACGFAGDHPGDPAEPVLYMGPLCPDNDRDSFPNDIDNCPSVANITQANQDSDEYGDACEQPGCVNIVNHWVVPNGDSDCDGYPDTIPGAPVTYRAGESVIGTVVAGKCAATPATSDEPLPDAWPPDFNDNQVVNIGDLISFNPHLGETPPNPRWDLNASGLINLSDFLQLNPFMGKQCTP